MDSSGPAFPQGSLDVERGYVQMTAAADCGLSVRDYFAAAVLPAVLHWQTTAGNPITFNAEMTAEAAYDIADAMLKRRAR